MKFLVFNSFPLAAERAHEEALLRGLVPDQLQDRTLYWWAFSEGADGKWALAVEDSYTPRAGEIVQEVFE